MANGAHDRRHRTPHASGGSAPRARHRRQGWGDRPSPRSISAPLGRAVADAPPARPGARQLRGRVRRRHRACGRRASARFATAGRRSSGGRMTKRRKRRPYRPSAAQPPDEAFVARPARRARPARLAPRAPARPRRPARGARPMYGPPMGVSLAGGLAATLSTPAVVAFTAIAVLALWLLYSTVGALLVVTAGPTTSMLALPPLSSVLDLQFVLASIRLFDGWTTLAQIVLLILLRAWVTTVLV